jgi:hypothetical protein
MHAASSAVIRIFAASVALAVVLSWTTPRILAQSQSGFTYNGMDLISYSQSEYLNSSEAAQTIRAVNANYTAVMASWYVQTSDSTSIAPSSYSPSDAAVVAAIQSLQAQGITVVLKPHVDSIDGTWRGEFTWPSSDTTTAAQQAWLTAWFTSYQSFILHFAQIAANNNVGTLVIGTEFEKLTGNTCAGSCESYWLQYVINPIRTAYPSMKLVYGAGAAGAGDEFTAVSFWNDVDILGVDGYFPLTNHADPTIAELVSAWSNNVDGFNPLAALQNLQSTYQKPLIFTEIGYTSTAGANEAPYDYTPTGAYDPTEQQNCYEAYFEVFSPQASWMKGVFWWDWSVSVPVSSDTGYSPQTKPAGDTTLPKWYGVPPSFSLSASPDTVSVAQGGSVTSTITVTDVGGFAGSVSFLATGFPSGVTGSFSAGTAAGTKVLTITAKSTANTVGPVAVTVSGMSGNIVESTTIALTVTGAPGFTVSIGGGSISIQPGAATGNTAPVSVAGSNGFTGTVSLTCSISPTAANDPATCSLTPSSVNISGTTAATPTLTITTTAASTAKNSTKTVFWPSAGGTALALVLLFGVPRRRGWLAMLTLLALFASMGMVGGAVGCGGGGGGQSGGGGGGGGGGAGGTGNPGTTAGTYTVSVTGTSGALTGIVGTVSLVVQ